MAPTKKEAPQIAHRYRVAYRAKRPNVQGGYIEYVEEIVAFTAEDATTQMTVKSKAKYKDAFIGVVSVEPTNVKVQ